MSRHGYCDELDQQDIAMWRGRVMSAIRGKRGQQLLRNMIDALDAMPVKQLITGELVSDDGVCALGACGRARKMDGLDKIDMEDPDQIEDVAHLFNVAGCLIKEIAFENDDIGDNTKADQEARWRRMRAWCAKHIRQGAAA